MFYPRIRLCLLNDASLREGVNARQSVNSRIRARIGWLVVHGKYPCPGLDGCSPLISIIISSGPHEDKRGLDFGGFLDAAPPAVRSGGVIRGGKPGFAKYPQSG